MGTQGNFVENLLENLRGVDLMLTTALCPPTSNVDEFDSTSLTLEDDRTAYFWLIGHLHLLCLLQLCKLYLTERILRSYYMVISGILKGADV